MVRLDHGVLCRRPSWRDSPRDCAICNRFMVGGEHGSDADGQPELRIDTLAVASSVRIVASDCEDHAALSGVATRVIRASILSAILCAGSRNWATVQSAA